MYRYSEGGMSFLLVDGRDVEIPRFRKPGSVHDLCLVHSVDGIAVLDRSDIADFRVSYIGADGKPGSGRALDGAALCAVAFADLVGVKAFHSTDYTVELSGEALEAHILSHLGECKVVTLSRGEGSISGSTLCEGEAE